MSSELSWAATGKLCQDTQKLSAPCRSWWSFKLHAAPACCASGSVQEEHTAIASACPMNWEDTKTIWSQVVLGFLPLRLNPNQFGMSKVRCTALSSSLLSDAVDPYSR